MATMLDWAKTLTPEEARAFIRRVSGKTIRVLKGDEYDKVWTMINLAHPVSTSNNQRTWTDVYIIGNEEESYEYHVTWWSANELPDISLILKDEEENV